MRAKTLGLILATFLITSPAAMAAGIKDINLAVKRGQKTVDARKLPLACLTFVLQGQPMFLNHFVVQSLDTKQEFNVECIPNESQHDPQKTELLTANQGKDRSLTQAIISLPPGSYRLQRAIFTYPGRDGSLMNGYFSFIDQDFVFTVVPDAANYLGSLILTGDWNSPDTHLPVKQTVENTTPRDRRWASDMVPGMAKIASVASLLEIKPRSP